MSFDEGDNSPPPPLSKDKEQAPAQPAAALASPPNAKKQDPSESLYEFLKELI